MTAIKFKTIPCVIPLVLEVFVLEDWIAPRFLKDLSVLNCGEIVVNASKMETVETSHSLSVVLPDFARNAMLTLTARKKKKHPFVLRTLAKNVLLTWTACSNRTNLNVFPTTIFASTASTQQNVETNLDIVTPLVPEINVSQEK